jgi:transcription-repair coupling factor (superfamily II helicase)
LKEIAEKRLAAIREFTDLGSGFKIAMRDLEIRGAGNLLGAEQHGHMEAVGYDMYCKMLNEAVKHLKGELSEEDTFTTALDVNVDAYIPDSYIPNEYHKLDIYKRIATIESEEEMDDMIEELIDRFGDIPKKVELLLEVARLKNLAHQAYVTEVTQKGVTYTFRMYEKAKIHVERIPDLLKQFPEDLSFKADVSDPKFIYQRKKKTKRGEVENPIEVVKKVLIGIKGLLD